MGNDLPAETWGKYIKRLSDRPGWSVVRIARGAGMNPATLFEYIRLDDGRGVKASTIAKVARGAEDDPVNAFRAAAGLTSEDPEDEEIAMVLTSTLDDDGKSEIIEDILRRRDRDRQHRMQDTVQMIRLAEGAERKAG
jgi:hypothetical protein